MELNHYFKSQSLVCGLYTNPLYGGRREIRTPTGVTPADFKSAALANYASLPIN